jgi:trigger factor
VPAERRGEVGAAAQQVSHRPGPQPGLEPLARWLAAGGAHAAARYRGGRARRLEEQRVKTTVTELADSRVRVQVEVPPGELEGSIERKAQQLARELKLPGFRRGKVPAPLVIRRVGREAVLEQTVRDALSTWYSDAIDSAGIVPVGDPQLDLGSLPPEGEALEFSIEIGVVPKAELGGFEDLEVPRREPVVEDELIEREIELIRDRLARLQTASRPAAKGDFVVVDYRGWLQRGDSEGERGGRGRRLPGGDGRDQLVELGGGNLLEGFEEGLLGAQAGETRTVEVSFPSDYSNAELAGRQATLEVTVKEVKAKQLPDVDEDLAIDAGFDGLPELREDIRGRLLELEQARIEGEFRQAALDAVVARARVGVTPELVKARAREMWERMLRALSRRGISPEGYAQVSGRSEQETLAELEPDAEQALRREAVLTAIVAAEGITVSDEELLRDVGPTAEREGIEPAMLLEQLRSAGRLDELREEEAARKAVELIAARAKPISVGQAQARERLWTPGGERPEEPEAVAAPGRLWTPDDHTQAS